MTDALITKLKISMWSPRIADRPVTREVQEMKHAGIRAGVYRKNLIEPTALSGVQACVTNLRNQHYRYTRPWEDDGRRLLPLALQRGYEDCMKAEIELFDGYADLFAEKFPDHVQEARAELGDMWNGDDYPTEVRSKFSAGYYFEPVPKGASLPMSAEQRAELAARIDRDAQARLAESARGLSMRVRTSLEEVKRRLTSYSDKLDAGERTKFHVSVLDEITELAGLLPMLNIEHDPFLDGVAARLSAGLVQERADLLKTDPGKREAAMAEVDEILRKMDGGSGAS